MSSDESFLGFWGLEGGRGRRVGLSYAFSRMSFFEIFSLDARIVCCFESLSRGL